MRLPAQMPRVLLLAALAVAAALVVLPTGHAQSSSCCSSITPPSLNSNYFNPFLYLSPYDNITFDLTPSPLPFLSREGAVYASNGLRYLWVGGGVNMQLGVAYSDLWQLDTISDSFVQCPSLPFSLSYATSQWSAPLQAMVVYGGVTSAPTSPDTYLSSVYMLQLSTASSSACTYSTAAISPGVPGRKFASSALLGTILYVWGGYSSSPAVSLLNSSASWFSVDLVANTSSLLPLSANAPAALVGAAMMVDAAALLIYVYGGISSPLGTAGSTAAPSNLIYRFDTERGLWLSPITPFIAANSAQTAAFPLIALACSVAADPAGEGWLFVGGTDMSPNNSVDVIVLVDLSTDSTMGLPTVSTLFPLLPYGIQGCAVGRNELNELTLLTGASTGIDATNGYYPSSVLEMAVPPIASPLTVDVYSSFLPVIDTSGEWAVSGRPLAREGAAYGCDGALIYMAGGVFLTSSSVVALSDIWVLNSTDDAFIATSASLPVGLYYAVSEWSAAAQSLFIFGGRTNTQGNALSNTYNSALYQVSFTNLHSPLVTAHLLTSSNVTGMQFAASALQGSTMFVFGGLAGANGTMTLPSQQFLSISLSTFSVNILRMTGLYDYVPSTVWVSPTLIPSTRYIYLYGGLFSDWTTFSHPEKLYVFDPVTTSWLPDIFLAVSAYSALPSQWPLTACAGRAYSADGLHVLLVGGSYGDRSVNGAGSHRRIVHLDLSNSSSPVVSVLPSLLVQPTQWPVVGLAANNQALFIFSGAIYISAASTAPASYSLLMQEALQTGYEGNGQVQYSPIIQVTPTPLSLQTTSVTSISSGQLAGVVIGSVLGVGALCILGALLITGKWRDVMRGQVWVSGRHMQDLPVHAATGEAGGAAAGMLTRLSHRRRAAALPVQDEEDEEEQVELAPEREDEADTAQHSA